MPICPNCGFSYREGFQKCSDCNVDLIDELNRNQNIVEEKNRYDNEKDFSFLMNVLEEYKLVNIEALLESHGIPLTTGTKGSGEYLRIGMGVSYHGFDLYVPEERLEEAKEIINTFYEYNDEDSSEVYDKFDEDNYSKERIRKVKNLFLILWIPSMLIGLLIILKNLFK